MPWNRGDDVYPMGKLHRAHGMTRLQFPLHNPSFGFKGPGSALGSLGAWVPCRTEPISSEAELPLVCSRQGSPTLLCQPSYQITPQAQSRRNTQILERPSIL